MTNLALLIYRNKFALPSLPPPGTFKDWHVLITGASGGLGLATAAHFVRLGASRVIITARSLSRGEAAKAQIEEETGTAGKDIVQVMELQMDTLSSTRAFAEKVKSEVDRIDYVLLNAGVLHKDFKMGEEGFEESVQVNVLSSALLGLLLLPWMKIAGRGKSHMGIVTSGRHRSVDVEKVFPEKDVLRYFSREETFPGTESYQYTKLMLQYVANELAKLALGPDGKPQVIINPMCPGLVYTDLGRDYKTSLIMTAAVNTFMSVLSKSSEGGARTPVLAALTTSDENGKYITHYQADEDYKIATEKSVFGPTAQKMQAQVWEEVLSVLEAQVPEVRSIANPTA